MVSATTRVPAEAARLQDRLARALLREQRTLDEGPGRARWVPGDSGDRRKLKSLESPRKSRFRFLPAPNFTQSFRILPGVLVAM